jgi:SH3-like domain-containing protein
MSRYPQAALLTAALALSACQTPAPRAPSIGEAFAGPASLEIHREIAPRSAVVATAHYGDKLQIVSQHRHFLKVRTEKGAEGWVADSNLLDRAAIDSLKELATNSNKFPSQGKATTYDVLNVHTEPAWTSPSFLRMQPAERVDVIGHRTAPRNSPARKPLVLTKPTPRKTREKKQNTSKVLPPPPPPPPKPPADWIELSKMRDPEEPETPKPVDVKTKPPADNRPPDDWTLIRNASGQAGWVLSRRIFMAIPDEVAQYAEGKRITSYFSLCKTEDEDKIKDIWLWTTMENGPQDHDFDSFRVFIWSRRHHRYETAYILRRIRGFYPVIASKGSFSVLIEKDDGKRHRQRFSMLGDRVKFDGEE